MKDSINIIPVVGGWQLKRESRSFTLEFETFLQALKRATEVQTIAYDFEGVFLKIKSPFLTNLVMPTADKLTYFIHAPRVKK